MDRKQSYIAPEFTIVQIKTERGYAISNTPEIINNFNLFDENDNDRDDKATTFETEYWQW